jgi:LPXTG-motif cell wall-anchored protein
MKRVFAIIAVLTLCCAMFMPAAAAENEFTPSVTNKPAPEIVPVIDPDGNPAIGVLLDDDGQIISYVYKECLIVTSVSEANTSTEIPEASREVLLDVYGKLTSGKMTIPYEKHDSKLNTSNMVIRDLYDATFVCNEHPKMLEPEGVVFRITFDINVAKDVDVYTMTYKDNGILIEIFSLSPFLVSWAAPVAENPEVETEIADLPKTGDTSSLMFFAALGCTSIAAMMLMRKKKNA